MKTKIIFAGLLGLAVMLPLAACSEPPTDVEKGLAAFEAKDYRTALRWFSKAAEQGNAIAQNKLGQMYYFGYRVVTRNHPEAARWYRKAAEQGLADAQNSLGTMYHYGQGIPQDFREAARWYRKAAEQGLTQAQFLLGVMYLYGQGIPQDYVQAHKWLHIASALGYQDAKKLWEEAEKKMTAQQIAEAQKEATEWLEAHKKRRP